MIDRAKHAKSKSTFKMRTTWSYLDVVRANHHDEVNKLAEENSGSKAGSQAYLACYKPALKELEEGLTEDQRIRYRGEAIKWTEEKPPRSEQYRYVYTNYSSRCCRWEIYKFIK